MSGKQSVFRYLIPVNPVPKKNSQDIFFNKKTGKPFIKQSPRYEAFATAAAYFLRPKPSNPITYPVNVKAVYYRDSRRKVDTSNLDEALHDILVENKILKDDCRDIIASTDGTRTFYDKENPRVEVEITPYEGEYEQWASE